MNILETKNLEKVYDAFSLRDINLEVKSGEITALVGENGAGKSTTIGCLSGIKKKNGGKILFKGKDMDSLSREERSEIAFAYDEISFPLEFTVSQVGKYGSLLYSNWDEGKWLNLLTKLSLPKDLKLKELSKGMKAKTEIAYSLSHDPSLLILDSYDTYPQILCQCPHGGQRGKGRKKTRQNLSLDLVLDLLIDRSV